jgi:hypothetical protein
MDVSKTGLPSALLDSASLNAAPLQNFHLALLQVKMNLMQMVNPH